MKILVINCGSSSLKYQLIDMDDESVLAKGLCERIGIEGSFLKHTVTGKDSVVINSDFPDHKAAMEAVSKALIDPEMGVVKSLCEIGAVGHRVVHGGEAFSAPVIISKEVKDAIDKCSAMAPLHNPANLTGIKACEEAMPGVPQVAVFDTAFHQTMPKEAYIYAIPYEYYLKYSIRKYGFHGTSHKFVAGIAALMLKRPIEDTKIITCHIGNGGSVTAVLGGKSVDTSMGFTPLDGVEMGTRCGLLDPEVPLFIMEKENLSIQDARNLLNKQSGLAGVSGISSDMRDVVIAAEKGNERAQLAIDLFNYRIVSFIGQYAAVMNGVDAIVFTAGIGENGPDTRSAICKRLGFLGVKIDEEINMNKGGEFEISVPESKVKVYVISTNEELAIARETKGLCEK